MRIQLSLAGDVQLDRTLLRFADRTDDMRPVLTALAGDFYKIEKQQFSGQGRFSGGWAPLSPDYAARKKKKYPNAKILVAEGALRDSLTRNGARGHVRAITADSLTIGTTIPYAGFHQTGTSRMPRRRPLEFTEATRQRWVKALLRYLTTGEVDVSNRAIRPRPAPGPTT